MLTLLAAAAIGPLLAAPVLSPAQAAEVAHADAVRIHPHDRIFVRYLWWPPGWPDEALLTRAQQAMLSDRGDFPNPVRVAPHLYRLDARESGWDLRKKNGQPTGLQVWEKFAATDFVFHVRWKFLEDGTVTVYYPQGTYDGKWYIRTSQEKRVKAGETIDRPAPWANPLVDPKALVGAQDELRKLLYTEVPILSGPFFLVRTMRQLDLDNLDHGTGYYNFLGIRNRQDYFDFIGLDDKVARAKFTELRELVKRSGISNQERILGTLSGATGRAWFTLDFKSQKGRGQPARNLLPGEAEHDAEEWIAPKPDGLPITSLNAAKANAAAAVKAGDVQANAPDFIGGNRSAANVTNDLRIHPHPGSCSDCHAKDNFIASFDGWARKKFIPGKAALIDPDKRVQEELRFLYLRDLEWEVKRSRDGFARAVARLTSTGPKDPGLTVPAFFSKMQGAYYSYVWPKGGVTAEIASQEFGVPKDRFLANLRAYNRNRGASDQILSDFLDAPDGWVTRLAWEDSFQFAAVIGLGLNVPELVLKRDRE